MCNKNQIGDRIKNIREALSLSQLEFASKLGISRSAISSYEQNQHAPSETLIRLIAGTYNININYLLNNEEPMFLDTDYTFKIPQDKIQIFEDFCKAYSIDTKSKKILQKIINLPDSNKHIVYEFLKFIEEINTSK